MPDPASFPNLIMGKEIFQRLEDLGREDPPDAGSADAAIAALRHSGLFDAAWYLEQYPDIAASGGDAIAHYARCGEQERRMPVPWFSPAYYASEYPDVAEAGVNLFCHYIYVGYGEKRRPGDFNKAAAKLAQKAHALGENGCVKEAAGKYEEAIGQAQTLDFVFSCLMAQGELLLAVGPLADAEAAHARARALFPNNAENLAALGRCLLRQGKWWQAIEATQKAVGLDEDKAWWWEELGIALEKMGRLGEAAAAFDHALALNGEPAEWHYRLGYVYERSGLYRQAQKAYREAIARDEELNAQVLGIGAFHQRYGHRSAALRAWQQKVQNQPVNAEVYAKLAENWLKAQELEKAASAALHAVALISPANKDLASTRWRACFILGLTLERLGRLEEAEHTYATALAMRPTQPLIYRRGYALWQLGRPREACVAWEEMGDFLEPDSCTGGGTEVSTNVPARELVDQAISEPEYRPTSCNGLLQTLASSAAEHFLAKLQENYADPALHFQAGYWLEKAGRLAEAAAAYAASAARQSEHAPVTWQRLGRVLACLGRHDEACEAYAMTQILRRPAGVAAQPWAKATWQMRSATYLEFCQCLPVAERTILYENMSGISVGDNPQGIFLHMFHEPAWAGYTHVWVLENLEDAPAELQRFRNENITHIRTP